MVDCEKLLNEFLARFPLESLKNMLIDDYVLNGNEDNFCWWLEYKTKPIGNISGGTSFNHGIYKKAKVVDSDKSRYSQDDVYAWFSKYGNTADEAFEVIRKTILAIATAATKGDYKKIDEIDFSPSAKMKIAFMYSNKQLINVFKKDAINYLAKKHNIEGAKKEVANKSHQLANLIDEDDFWNSRFWEEWEESDEFKKQKPISYWACGFNFDGKDNQYKRFIQESIWEGIFDEKKDKSQIKDARNIKNGDAIALKTSYTKGKNHSISTIKIFAIGVVKTIKSEEKYAEGKIRFLFDVDYIFVKPQKEIENCSYRKTIELVRDDDLKRFIDEFLAISEEETMENKLLNDCKSLLLANHNIILHGAPGTGKTHLAKEIANAMGEKGDGSDVEIGFVQFHPSYDYTDFVEGLRPRNGDDGQIGFERKDGVFKEFCKKAIESVDNGKLKIDNFDESWEMLIEKVRDTIAENKLLKIGKWEYGLSTVCSLKYTSVNTNSNYNFTITKDNVYKTYQHKIARPSGQFQKDMEDIVQYMKDNFDLKDYVAPQLSTLNSQLSTPYVFIIDEINRGEISKIFGELFFSIDPGYRGEKWLVQTQYQNLVEEGDVFKKGFFVPENVYIIGTMNDIDRSVESMDFAMRRRFIFKEITAAESAENMNLDDEAKRRMTALNDEISKIDGLSSSYHIGAAYFLKNEIPISTEEEFNELWDLRLESLLTEYLRGTGNEDKIDDLRKAYGKEEK